MLKVEKLSVLYKSTGKVTFHDISFDLKKGEILAILGPSGCGKTTLLNIISGLLNDKEAEIKGSVDLKCKTVRYVFQEDRLLPWRTVMGNVLMPLEIKGLSKEGCSKKVMSLLRMIKMEDFASYYPSQLSMGMKQRVNFARALASSPDLLLLDEPFSAIDPETKEEMRAEFKKIIKEQKLTAIFVTHDYGEALEMADRIILLGRDGVKDILHKKELVKERGLTVEFDPLKE